MRLFLFPGSILLAQHLAKIKWVKEKQRDRFSLENTF